jgi:hypothetical protein
LIDLEQERGRWLLLVKHAKAASPPLSSKINKFARRVNRRRENRVVRMSIFTASSHCQEYYGKSLSRELLK